MGVYRATKDITAGVTIGLMVTEFVYRVGFWLLGLS